MTQPQSIAFPLPVPPNTLILNGALLYSGAGMAVILLAQATLALTYATPGVAPSADFPTPTADQMAASRAYIVTGTQQYVSQVTKEPLSAWYAFALTCQLAYDNWCNTYFGKNAGGVPVPVADTVADGAEPPAPQPVLGPNVWGFK